MLLYALKTVKELRDEYTKRTKASAYASLPPSQRPVDLPAYDDTSPLPFELKPVIYFLEEEQNKV
jgi:alpha-ketoglutarate-dependent dioxygenase FTO